MAFYSSYDRDQLTLGRKLLSLNWVLLMLLCLVAAVGFATLYSVGNGNVDPWAKRHAVRFGLGIAIMMVVALTDIRIWYRLAYPIYGLAIALLIAVAVMGTIGKGAERWIDLKVIQLQPSELMKVALIMALARYFHRIPHDRMTGLSVLIIPMILTAIPVALVLKQPDLGTALLLVFEVVALLFLAGVAIRWFLAAGAAVAVAVPIGLSSLKEYQMERIRTFLDPERDPTGAGYHILQSKIAFGSGGMSGRGFLKGTQSQLNFLPEKQTDFIFTMFAEEFGFLGGLGLLGLYLLITLYVLAVAVQISHQFGRLLVMGLCVMFFLYVFINAAMVMGLIPVVGVPMPLVSYGGTSMLTVMIAFGLIMSAHIHRSVDIPRYSSKL